MCGKRARHSAAPPPLLPRALPLLPLPLSLPRALPLPPLALPLPPLALPLPMLLQQLGAAAAPASSEPTLVLAPTMALCEWRLLTPEASTTVSVETTTEDAAALGGAAIS